MISKMNNHGDKRNFLAITLVAFLGLTSFAKAPLRATALAEDESKVKVRRLDPFSDFCWLDSYGRGVGKIPLNCPGKDKLGAFCYEKCPHGYYRFGFNCRQYCLEGWRDDGLYCNLPPYGRGAGHTGESNCESKEGKDCEKNGLLWYPKCETGYYHSGCCFCTPYSPDCEALGYKSKLGTSCKRYIKYGDPKSMECAPGMQRDAGLCYPYCEDGYKGVGPVCWGTHPDGWVSCGMGAATDSATCRNTIKDQILSVGEMAVDLATFGAAGIAKGSSKAATQAQKFLDLKKKIDEFQDNKEFMSDLQDSDYDWLSTAGDTVSLFKVFFGAYGVEEPADITRVAAQVAAIFDPTGTSGVIAAYSYPKCSAYFGPPKALS